jgi:hypothetical protein
MSKLARMRSVNSLDEQLVGDTFVVENRNAFARLGFKNEKGDFR